MQRVTRLVHRQRHDVKQDIGASALRIFGAGQPTHLTRAHGQRPALLKQPLRAHLRQAQRIAHIVIERMCFAQLHNHTRLVMVLQIGAYFGRIDFDIDAVPAQ